MSKDPVCGMTVDASHAASRSEFEGASYYFCCSHCKRQFDANPHQFVAPKAPTARIPCCGFGMGMVKHTIQRGRA